MDYFLTLDFDFEEAYSFLIDQRRSTTLCKTRCMDGSVHIYFNHAWRRVLTMLGERTLSHHLHRGIRDIVRGAETNPVFDVKGVVRSSRLCALNIYVDSEKFKTEMQSKGFVPGDIEISIMVKLLETNEYPTVHALYGLQLHTTSNRVFQHLRGVERHGSSLLNGDVRNTGVYAVGTSGWFLTHQGGLFTRSPENHIKPKPAPINTCSVATVIGNLDETVDRDMVRYCCTRAPSLVGDAGGGGDEDLLEGTAARSRAVLIVTSTKRIPYWTHVLRDRNVVSVVNSEKDVGIHPDSNTDVVLVTGKYLRSMRTTLNGPESMLPAHVCQQLHHRVESMSQYAADVRLPEWYGGVSQSIFRSSVVERVRASKTSRRRGGPRQRTYLPAWAITWSYCIVDLPTVIRSEGAVPSTMFWEISGLHCSHLKIVSLGTLVGPLSLTKSKFLAWATDTWHISPVHTLRPILEHTVLHTPSANRPEVVTLDPVVHHLSREEDESPRTTNGIPHSILRVVRDRGDHPRSPLTRDPETCTICYENTQNIRLVCNHAMCHRCTQEIFYRNRGSVRCPFCRAITDNGQFQNMVPMSTIALDWYGAALYRLKELCLEFFEGKQKTLMAIISPSASRNKAIYRFLQQQWSSSVSTEQEEIPTINVSKLKGTSSSVLKRIRRLWHLQKNTILVGQFSDIVGLQLKIKHFILLGIDSEKHMLTLRHCTAVPAQSIPFRIVSCTSSIRV